MVQNVDVEIQYSGDVHFVVVKSNGFVIKTNTNSFHAKAPTLMAPAGGE